MAGGMSRGGGTPLKDRTRRGGGNADDVPEASREEAAGRHCWVVDSPGHPGRWPGVLLEWRRVGQRWDGLVAYVIPEPHGEGVRLVERWVGADHLERV
jgi:hypothetical protein